MDRKCFGFTECRDARTHNMLGYHIDPLIYEWQQRDLRPHTFGQAARIESRSRGHIYHNEANFTNDNPHLFKPQKKIHPAILRNTLPPAQKCPSFFEGWQFTKKAAF
jgi:hypothetical protein